MKLGLFLETITNIKDKCLHDAGKEIGTPLYALQKDEEYYADLKSCVKTTLIDFVAKRDSKYEEIKDDAKKY